MNTATVIYIIGFVVLFSFIPMSLPFAIIVSIIGTIASGWCIVRIQRLLDRFKR